MEQTTRRFIPKNDRRPLAERLAIAQEEELKQLRRERLQAEGRRGRKRLGRRTTLTQRGLYSSSRRSADAPRERLDANLRATNGETMRISAVYRCPGRTETLMTDA